MAAAAAAVATYPYCCARPESAQTARRLHPLRGPYKRARAYTRGHTVRRDSLGGGGMFVFYFFFSPILFISICIFFPPSRVDFSRAAARASVYSRRATLPIRAQQSSLLRPRIRFVVCVCVIVVLSMRTHTHTHKTSVRSGPTERVRIIL